MFDVRVHDFGDLAIVRCAGRLTRGEAVTALGNAMTFRTSKRVILFDVSEMIAIDAGGVGLLASIGRWAGSQSIQLKLMNPSTLVRRVLEATGLLSAFDVCTCEELAALFGLSCRSEAPSQMSHAIQPAH